MSSLSPQAPARALGSAAARVRRTAAPLLAVAGALLACLACGEAAGAAPPALPYSPVLDPAAMDRGIDPCVDFYAYSCGGWMKRNPVPGDHSSWGVYDKLHEDNLKFLGQVLAEAAQPRAGRDPLTVQIGDFFASCMDEAAIARGSAAPLRPDLDAIAAIRPARDL